MFLQSYLHVLCFFVFYSINANISAEALTSNEFSSSGLAVDKKKKAPTPAPTPLTSAPTLSPTSNSTVAPNVTDTPTITSSPTSTTTSAPTASNATSAPTATNVTTSAPTASGSSTSAPTASSTTNAPTTPGSTSAPTANNITMAPTASPNSTTVAPTQSNAPSSAPSLLPKKKKKGFFHYFFKTVSWMMFIALSALLVGKCMMHRTQIYFFMLELWYKIQRSEILEKVVEFLGGVLESIKALIERIRNRGNNRTGVSLNDAIGLDAGDLSEGLLLREST